MGFFEITVFDEFDAAHFLKDMGKCEELHGHRFKVGVWVRAEKLDERGIAFDFRELKKLLRSVVEELDHKLLNDIPFFKNKSPSSENIALFIYERLKNLPIHKIEVWESPTSIVSFYP